MIGRDIEVVYLADDQFHRLLELLAPRQEESGPVPETKLLVVIHEADRVVKATLSGKRLNPEGLRFSGPEDLAGLREETGASVAVAFTPDAIRTFLHQAESELTLDAPFLDQALILLRAFRAQVGTRIHVDPPGPLAALGVPTPAVVRRLLRWLLPPGRVAVFYAVEQHEGDRRIAASFICRQGRRGGVDLITTDAYLGEAGLDVRQWKEDAARVNAWITEHVGRIHLAVYGESSAFVELFASGVNVDLLAELVEEGRILITHRPLWLRVLLSARFRPLLSGTMRRFMG